MLQLMLLTMAFQQILQALTRRHFRRHLIWVCIVCVCPAYGILCLNGLVGHDVTANVANTGISANSAGPQARRYYIKIALGIYIFLF